MFIVPKTIYIEPTVRFGPVRFQGRPVPPLPVLVPIPVLPVPVPPVPAKNKIKKMSMFDSKSSPNDD